jgi:hypothetical protein
MVNPSAAQLQAVLAATMTEAEDVAMADRDVMAELRFNLRKKDPPSQRRIMRTYGAHFRYLEGEPMDPDEPVEGSEEAAA